VPKQTLYTVSQLNRETRQLLSKHFFSIQVEGEISNLSTPASGHIYFSLKDAKAQVRCAMFRMHNRRLNFLPENGQHIIVSAQVSLYEPRGDFQLIVENMQEAGAGALLRAFEALKSKLEEEGLFAPGAKKAIPHLPRAIGIITSPTGAAIKDILTVLKRRFAAIPIIIYPTAVQGKSAAAAIVAALKTANQRKECDILIITRGGGALEDLWPFNEETVARAVFVSKLPIISGIGHETDFTITDFVADLRAPTPSAAAEHSTPDSRQWLQQFQYFEAQLEQKMQRKIMYAQQLLDWLQKRLQQQHPGQQLATKNQRLADLRLRLNQLIKSKLQQCENKLQAQTAKLWRFNPAEKIKIYHCQQQNLSSRLTLAIQHNLAQRQQQLLSSRQTLHAVSPLATLDRGYAIVTRQDNSEIINSTAQLTTGEMVQTRLANGQFTSKIETIER
jgi:exodeoxyribonuclease VII large subunit